MKATTDVPATIDEYLGNLLLEGVAAEDVAALEKLRKQIKAVAAGMTESISYRIPTLALNGQKLVGFAAFAHHLSFFPMNSTILDAFAAEVAPYASGKSTLQFTAKEPLPATLIKKLVNARIAENEAVLAARAAKKAKMKEAGG